MERALHSEFLPTHAGQLSRLAGMLTEHAALPADAASQVDLRFGDASAYLHVRHFIRDARRVSQLDFGLIAAEAHLACGFIEAEWREDASALVGVTACLNHHDEGSLSAVLDQARHWAHLPLRVGESALDVLT